MKKFAIILCFILSACAQDNIGRWAQLSTAYSATVNSINIALENGEINRETYEALREPIIRGDRVLDEMLAAAIREEDRTFEILADELTRYLDDMLRLRRLEGD